MTEPESLKLATNTVTCPIDHVINKNCYVLSTPHIKCVSKVDNNVSNGVDLSHFNYNTEEKVTTFLDSMNLIVDWSSDLKVVISSYVNFIIPKMIEEDKKIPEINDLFFTQVINQITGKQKNTYYDEFSKIYKITSYFPWLSNSSQIVSFIKNEMSTVSKNNIILNTNKRMLANIRWRLLNYMFIHEIEYDVAKLQEVIDSVFSNLIEAKIIKLKNEIYFTSEVCNNIFKEDIGIIKNLLLDDPDSRSNKLKIKKALAKNKELKVSTEVQNFHYMLKKNPQKFLVYLYYLQKKINNLPLSLEYMKFSDMSNEKMSKEEIKEIWKDWKYNRVKMPSFKLMPLNNISRQFIRIDKRTLSNLSIATCEGVITLDYEIPSKFLNKKHIFEESGMTLYRVKNNFFTKDNKDKLETDKGYCLFHDPEKNHTLLFREICKSEIDSRKDKWWLDDVVDIYSKKANIRQLRREILVRNPETLVAFNTIKSFLNNKTYNCWVPGASFLTDGVQFKLPLLADRNDRTRGLDILFEKGFTGFKSKTKNTSKIDISRLSKGIYHDTKDNIFTNNPKNMVITGIDPGRKRPLSSCTVESSDLPDDWNDNKRMFALDKSMDNNVYVSNDEYRKHTGSLEAQEKEKKRRVGDYKKALENMLNTNKRSALIEVNNTYYARLFESWNAIRTEKFNIKRSHHRFKSYSKSRKSLAHFAKKVTNELKIKCQKTGKQGVVMIGNGTFRPGGTGQASVPRKPFIREIGIRYPVIITNEYNTSKLHPFSFEELKDVQEKDKKTTNNERLRMCKTNSGNSEVDFLMSKERDRDTFGSCSIMQKGYYQLIGNPITSLHR